MRHTYPPVLRRRLVAAVLLAGATAACSDPLAPHSDVDAARADWLATGIADYRFELRVVAFLGTDGYVAIRVEDNTVVAVDGEIWHAPTIEALWDDLLTARESGDLNYAVFDRRGVPVEFSVGSLADDSGVRYLVRRFTPG
jgi:hypothetical protein